MRLKLLRRRKKMGHKVNPKAFRIGPVYTWNSRWFANDTLYRKYVAQDMILRNYLMKQLKLSGIAQIDIERSINKIDITLFVSKPGMAIGRGGSGLEVIKKQTAALIKKRTDPSDKLKFEIKVEPIKSINLNAHLVATYIADQLIRRVPHKSVVNQSMSRVMSSGARGVKVLVAGRINGAEISRRERFQQGTVPLSTIREKIDYASVPALTKSGYIGIKVWICPPLEG